MVDMKRRDLLAGGMAGAAVLGGVAACGGAAKGVGRTGAQDIRLTGPGSPTLPPAKHTYKFELTKAKPQLLTSKGTVTTCTVKNFPVLEGSDAAIFLLKLDVGGLREPHWHPNAWELNYCVAGRGRLGVITPEDTTDLVDLHPGDVGFIPRGWAHFIQNVGNTELTFAVVFGNNEPNDIGLSSFFGGAPSQTFAATLGVPESALAHARKPTKTLFIVGER